MKNTFSAIVLFTILVLTASCASNEEPKPDTGKLISLGAVVPNGPKEASSTTTTASIQEFTVYAFTGGNVLMDGVKVVRDGGSWTYSPDAYWPVTPVNFYAYSPEIATTTSINQSEGDIPAYLNQGDVDLLYSVQKDVMQQPAPVSLNFRHALSKVSVMLSSNNPRIRVMVSYVCISNLYQQGSFQFPQSSTLATMPDVVGSWSDLKSKATMITFAVIGYDDQVELTPQPTDLTVNTLNHSFVIPQPLANVSLSESGYSGNYIEVDCEIFDVATGAKLWPNSHTPDYMLVPHTQTGRIIYKITSDNINAFLPGHAYIYNISIDNPSVLDKIEFNPTVDEYSIDEM